MRVAGLEEQGSSSGSNYGSDISFQSIALFHLARIAELASKDWYGGTWLVKRYKLGDSVVKEDYYVEDTREAYGHAVDCLHDLMIPLFGDDMKEKSEDIYYKIRQLDKDDADRYKARKVKLKRELFQELQRLLAKKGYFKEGTYRAKD